MGGLREDIKENFMIAMHDWVLRSITFDWKLGKVSIEFDTYAMKSTVVFFYAEDVSDLHVPRGQEWGPSVSVNEVIGPEKLADGKQRIRFEIQTGDIVEITAKNFIFPEEANRDGGNK